VVKNHHREVIQGVTLPWLLPKAAVAPRTHSNVGYGTCEAQVLRSTCEWSIGSGPHTETSILHAYRYAISNAEHFIYIGTPPPPRACRACVCRTCRVCVCVPCVRVRY
jgi:hypothetical protein